MGLWEEAAKIWFTLGFAEIGSCTEGGRQTVHAQGVFPPTYRAAAWLLRGTLPASAQFPLAYPRKQCMELAWLCGKCLMRLERVSHVWVWLWLTVSITWEESSHYGEAVGWEKIGRRPASLPGGCWPSFTGRTCRAARGTSDEDMQRQRPSASSKWAGGAWKMSIWACQWTCCW